MKREEAIKILRKEIECLSHTKCEDCILEAACDPIKTTPYDSEYIEVYDMAIKALEQEPKILDALDFAIDASNGDTNYFVGFRNGLRYAKSLIDGEEEPQFEHCTEQEPSEDAISRQDVLDLAKKGVLISNGNFGSVCKAINELSSVNPQPKTGHWIYDEILDKHYYCSECKSMGVDYWDFCPSCGAKMQEVEE